MTRGDNVGFSGNATLEGEPYDLAGCLLYFTAKRQYTDADSAAIFQKSVGSGITITNPTQGLFTVAIAPLDTAALSKVKTILVWDLQLQDGSGKIYTLAQGNLVVNPDVTNI